MTTKSTNAITIDPNAEVAIIENGYSDSSSNFELPRWRIDKDSGLFIHDYGDEYETINAALLKVDQSRVLWPADYVANSRPDCRSHNLKFPEERDPLKAPFGGLDKNGLRICENCSLSEWGGEENQRIKPPCAIVYDLLLLDLKTEILGVLSLMRTRLKTARKLDGFWKTTAMRFSVQLNTTKEHGPRGQWYALQFKRDETFTTEERQQLISMAIGFKHWSLSAVTTEIAMEDSE